MRNAKCALYQFIQSSVQCRACRFIQFSLYSFTHWENQSVSLLYSVNYTTWLTVAYSVMCRVWIPSTVTVNSLQPAEYALYNVYTMYKVYTVYNVCTIYTVYTVYNVYTVYTVYYRTRLKAPLVELKLLPPVFLFLLVQYLSFFVKIFFDIFSHFV